MFRGAFFPFSLAVLLSGGLILLFEKSTSIHLWLPELEWFFTLLYLSFQCARMAIYLWKFSYLLIMSIGALNSFPGFFIFPKNL